MKSISDFGAVGNNTVDDTAAIQTALDSEHALYIPAGVYRITQPLIQRKIMRIEGAGQCSRVVADFTSQHAGAWVHDISYADQTSVPVIGSTRGFSIEAPCPGLRFDLSSGIANFVNRLVVEQMFLRNTAGGYALELHNPTNTDGFFCSSIRDNFLSGGIRMPRLGDSVNIERNTITGPGDGINIDAVQGANMVVIRDNNITAQGYSMYFGSNLYGTKIENNNIEQVAGAPLYCVLFAGGAGGARIVKPTFRGNSINGHNKASISALVGANNVLGGVFDENNYLGGPLAEYFTGSTSGVFLGHRSMNSCPGFRINQGSNTTD